MIKLYGVNHHTYLRRLTLWGTVACVERLPEIVEVEITLPMITIRNFNFVAGSEVPFMQRGLFYVVNGLLN